MTDQSFTVSELNKYIKDVLTSGFPSAVWVCGEIQGLRVDQKGHTYFELCENEEEGNGVKAKIRASLWNTRRVVIDAMLRRAENGFSLKDDIHIRLLCRVDFWPKGGALSLSVENVDPTYTLGKIAQERQKLIALLKGQGVLEKNKTLELPPVMLRIGLITSEDSAAYNDFMDELRLSGYGFEVHLASAVMQGKTAPASVVAALGRLNAVGGLDAVVITRGGGSIAELSCFDSEAIARAVAASRLPVITGIGHEINTTITDLAAHTFAKTPTAVAQFLVGRIRDFLTGLDDRKRTLLDLSKGRIETERNALKAGASGLHTATTMYLRDHRDHISGVMENLKRLPVSITRTADKNIRELRERLIKTIRLNLASAAIKMGHYQKLVDLASPSNTLKRGFSITRTGDGKVLKAVQGIKKGERLKTELSDGSLTSEVI